jgi:hypothetical protein
MFRLGQYLTPAVLDKVHLWAHDSEAKHEMRFKERCSGVDALYFPVSDTLGIKIYTSERKAKVSWYVTRILYHYGCAPKLYDFRTIVHRGKTYYGFVTERCLVLGIAWNNRDSFNKIHRKILYRLYNKITETPFVADDDHEYNIGVNKHGKPVYIDVGHFCLRDKNGIMQRLANEELDSESDEVDFDFDYFDEP